MPHTTVITTCAAAGVAVMAIFTGAGAYKSFEDMTSPAKPRGINIIRLVPGEKDGVARIGQALEIYGDSPVKAEWFVKVKKNRKAKNALCWGSGVWTYNPRPFGDVVWFTLDEWAETKFSNQDCPEKLEVGNVLTLSFEYHDVNGRRLNISKNITIADKVTEYKDLPKNLSDIGPDE